MYRDYLFFFIGAIAFIVFAALVVFLFFSRKKVKQCKDIKEQSTKPFDTLNTITLMTKFDDVNNKASGTDIHSADTAVNPPTISTAAYVLESKPIENFNSKILEENYTLLRELKGGAMGRVFLARKKGVGNEWIVKFVPKHRGRLSTEAAILSELNHGSLPDIIDIFTDDKGIYLVQSFIPGYSMQHILKLYKESMANADFSEFALLDWAKQLAQVLSYLHTKKRPIYHFDLKPSNVMVEIDANYRLVLIDFGISQQQSRNTWIDAATFEYAAPEQLKALPSGKEEREKAESIIQERFISLPEERMTWMLDGRTDIYGLGAILFEIAFGERPICDNQKLLTYGHISKGSRNIIKKCLEIDPNNRYQTMDELLNAINVQEDWLHIYVNRTITSRKYSTIASVVLMPIVVGAFTLGAFARTLEVAAAMYVNPEIITVSVMQSSEVQITRVLPEPTNALLGFLLNDNESQAINPTLLRWETTANNIAHVDGNRIVGLNIGETIIHGRYRMQDIAMQVNVVEPMNGMVDISMRYLMGHSIRLFSGASQRERIDGSIDNANFSSPSSIDVTERGLIYFTDDGWLRRIVDNTIETIQISPSFLRPNIVRTYQDDVYFLAHTWQDSGGNYTGIVYHTNVGTEILHRANAQFTTIYDFVITSEYIYFIENNSGLGITLLRSINKNTPSNIRTLTELPQGTNSISVDGARIFFTNEVQGTILLWENDQVIYLAGAPNQRAFIDGFAPLFYRPSQIRYHNNALYIWDFNVLRRLFLDGNTVIDTISLVGKAGPNASEDFKLQESAENIILPQSRNADFIFIDDTILLSDPRRGLFWLFE